MPSVRPKLVEEGAPIAANATDTAGDDFDMKVADNLYVIGGGNKGGAVAPKSSLNSSLSSLSMNVGGGTMDASMNYSGRRGSGTRKGPGTSSLARAAKGTFIQEKTKRSSGVQTSFVIGGTPSNLQDEKKSGDSPGITDESRKRSPGISTSYQIPDNGNNNNMSYSQDIDMELDNSNTNQVRRKSKPTVQPTSFVVGVGGDPQMDICDDNHDHNETLQNDADDQVEKMEGVIDLSEKPPLCVLDGANIAYAYGKANQGGSSLSAEQAKPQPDVQGIVVTCDYFASAGIRVLAVIPQTWTIRDPYQKLLKKLDEKGLLVEAPSRDDDDAYCITIARREDGKARQRGDGPGYVMSNDMFRDAAARAKEEGGGDGLKEWLTEGSTLESGKTGPGRISFAFLDTGSMDDHGDKILDIMPNPRHPLIQFVEQSRANQHS